jgi:hypothetical protein
MQPEPVWAKPQGEFPVVLPDRYLLAQNDRAAIAVTRLSVYSTGFDISLHAVLHAQDRGGRVFGRGSMHPVQPGEPHPKEFLRFGVIFADGSAVTNLTGGLGLRPPGQPERGPVLLQNHARHDWRTYTASFWAWPLPPSGPVTLVCEWPAVHIGESRIDIDAQLITNAAAQATPIWPDHPQTD